MCRPQRRQARIRVDVPGRQNKRIRRDRRGSGITQLAFRAAELLLGLELVAIEVTLVEAVIIGV